MLLFIPFLSILSKPLTIPAIKQWSYKLGEYNFSEQTRILVDINNQHLLTTEAETFAEDLTRKIHKKVHKWLLFSYIASG